MGLEVELLKNPTKAKIRTMIGKITSEKATISGLYFQFGSLASSARNSVLTASLGRPIQVSLA